MRYAIVGAGAIGGLVGASLMRAGSEVLLIARGSHLDAMRSRGLTVRGPDDEFTVHPQLAAHVGAIEGADAVIIALKAHQIAPIAADIAAHLRTGACVVAMQNGLPWWYFERIDSPLAGLVLDSVDPAGRIAAALAYPSVIGCVVYASCEVIEPGVIANPAGRRFVLGEPSGEVSERVKNIAADFNAAGLEAQTDSQIRREIWSKLIGNAAYNPISALTRATTGEMIDHPHVSALVRQVMEETTRLARAAGAAPATTVEQRIEASRRYANVRSSMLQDLEAGRPLELDPMVGAIVELGERIGVDVSATRHVYALAKLLDATNAKKPVVART